MEITAVVESAKVEIVLDFLTTLQVEQHHGLHPRSNEGATTVTWTMTGPKTFMARAMRLLESMDARIGPDFALDELPARLDRRQRVQGGGVRVEPAQLVVVDGLDFVVLSDVVPAIGELQGDPIGNLDHLGDLGGPMARA